MVGGRCRAQAPALPCLVPRVSDQAELTKCGNSPLPLASLASCKWELFTVAQLKCLLNARVCFAFQISILARVTDTYAEISPGIPTGQDFFFFPMRTNSYKHTDDYMVSFYQVSGECGGGKCS